MTKQLYTFSTFIFILIQLTCTSTVTMEDESMSEEIASTNIEQSNEDSLNIVSTDISTLRTWNWDSINIPSYSWIDGIAFGDGLYVDTAFDPTAVSQQKKQLRFILILSLPLKTHQVLITLEVKSIRCHGQSTIL